MYIPDCNIVCVGQIGTLQKAMEVTANTLLLVTAIKFIVILYA